jgi:hypothetical protein
VFTIHWRLTGDDGEGHVADVYSTQAVIYKAGSPFTPYSEITQEQAQAWIENAMGADGVQAAMDNIASQIQDQITPKQVTLPAPWAIPASE